MKGLTANGDLQANLTNSSNTVISAFVSASTTLIEPVTLAVDIALTNTSSPSNTAYAFEVDVQYVVMAPWTIGVTAGYDGGSASNIQTNWFNQGVGDWTGIEVWPYLKANFDNGSYFKIGVVYGSKDKAGNSNAIIAVPIYYVWSF